MILVYLFTIAALVLVDQYSKQLIITYFQEFEQKEIIPNFFSLTYVKNTGAAWSMFEGQQIVFIVITIAAIIYFAYELLKKDASENILFRISSLLIIGGAIGNFIDRLSNQYVVDFLDFIIFSYDFPVFNVADCFLTIGVILYAIYTIVESKNAKN